MTDPMTPGWRGSCVVLERLPNGGTMATAPTAAEVAALLDRNPVLKAAVLRKLGAQPTKIGEVLVGGAPLMRDLPCALILNCDIRQPGDALTAEIPTVPATVRP